MADSIFGPPTKKARKPGIMAMKLAASAAPQSGDEGGDDESAETCTADISSDELQELQSGGTVTITSDEGEKIVLTLKEAGSDDSEEGTAPEGM